jgi:ribose transport system substrate-binding protein
MRRFKKGLVLVTMLTAMLAIAACGSSSKSTSSAAGATGGGQTSTSGGSTTDVAASGSSGTGSCGAIPTQMPADPDGVLAKFPKSVQAAYNLFPQAVSASAWTHWKPTHPGPYSIYFSPGNVSTPFVQSMMARFSQLKGKSGGIDKVVTQDSNNGVQTQIQQIQQAIRQKFDLLVVLPLSPAADAPVLEAAGKAGIPVIAPLNSAANKYVVGINGNVILEGAYLTQGLASTLGGKGSILEMQGIPGVQSSDLILKGANDVLKNCPDVKVAGSPVGQFTPSVAKAQTLQFLTSHPQQIDGAIQVGGMATGIMQAFIQTGRKVPSVADSGATPGALAYWSQHKGSYKGVALGLPPAALADTTWSVASGLLAGRGIKITDLSEKPLIITDANLSQWVQPGWSLTTPIAYAPGPPNVFFPPSYLNQFFTKPGK